MKDKGVKEDKWVNRKEAVRLYRRKIKEILLNKYKMTSKEVDDLFIQFNELEDLININEDYFFYQSPEYWADYLATPI